MKRITFFTFLLLVLLTMPLVMASAQQQQRRRTVQRDQRPINGSVSVAEGVPFPKKVSFTPITTQGELDRTRKRVEEKVDPLTGQFSAALPDDGKYVVSAYPPCYKTSDYQVDKDTDRVALKMEWAPNQHSAAEPGAVSTSSHFGIDLGTGGLGSKWRIFDFSGSLRYESHKNLTPGGGSLMDKNIPCDQVKPKTEGTKN